MEPNNTQKIYLQHFCYTSGPLVLAAAVGAVVNGTINIGADADFQCNYLTATVIQAGLVVVNWGGTILINDTAIGKTFTNAPAALDAFRGNGQLPYPFNPARRFRGNSSITITLTNNVATATTVEVVFHGNKILPVA